MHDMHKMNREDPVEVCDAHITIEHGDPGAGGAPVRYRITVRPRQPHAMVYRPQVEPIVVDLPFQCGDPGDGEGVNGITNEALLDVLLDRLCGFQSGGWPCDENEAALLFVALARAALRDRHRRLAGAEPCAEGWPEVYRYILGGGDRGTAADLSDTESADTIPVDDLAIDGHVAGALEQSGVNDVAFMAGMTAEEVDRLPIDGLGPVRSQQLVEAIAKHQEDASIREAAREAQEAEEAAGDRQDESGGDQGGGQVPDGHGQRDGQQPE